jgi:molybdopterin molybdotransferase
MALLAVADALARVLAGVEALPEQTIPLAQCCGRVLARDLAARRSQPPAAVSAMDGYAVRAADVLCVPTELRLIGEVAAGRPFAGTVGPGETARIFTGGIVPAGADSVIIQEATERDEQWVKISAAVKRGANVRPEALDFARGQIVLRKGRRLTDRDLALLASMNHPLVPVICQPKVAIIGTGDELVAPGSEPGVGQIVYSNGFALTALAQSHGAEAQNFGVVADRVDAIIAAIDRMQHWGANIVVTTGGASVGDYDLVGPALAAKGMTLSFWKVALRPGRPMMHGRLGSGHVLGLPGNPVSSYVCARLFLVPLISSFCGLADPASGTDWALLGADVKANDERTDYLRARLEHRLDGTLMATPFPLQDSAMLVPLANADCLVVREPYAAPALAGTRTSIIKLAL